MRVAQSLKPDIGQPGFPAPQQDRRAVKEQPVHQFCLDEGRSGSRPAFNEDMIDPVQFGIIMILNCGIGLNTPPVGAVQFVACAVGKISVAESMRTIWPFYGAGFAVLMLVTYVPAVSLWLPSLFH